MTTLVIGSSAVGSDGYRGEVQAVVIDPAARTVTHLVVEPHGRAGLARLVPLDLADLTGPAGPADLAGAPPGQVRLRCTEAEFRSLDAAEETLAEFVPGYPDPVQLLPPGWRGAGGATADGGRILRIPEHETVAIVPPGEVEEHRGDRVHATDGEAGRLRAVRIDAGTGRVTHVLVRHGPAWDRADTAIPAEMVAGFGDGIRLSVTRQQVRDLR